MKSLHETPFANFIWFMGVVEDINDPMKVNRVRVRAIGFHTEDRNAVPHDTLPWAPFLSSTTQMSSPLVLPGDWVFGFFMDGQEAQQPMIVGSFVGIPKKKDKKLGFFDPEGTYPRHLDKGTNSPCARGETDLTPVEWKKANLAPDEPATPYAPKYPTNHVIHTDKDQIIELDDTPNKERVHVFHRSGTFYEMHPDGKFVVRSVSDMYEACFANRTMYVTGNLKVMVAGDSTISTTGDTTISTGGDMILKAGGDMTLSAGGDIKATAGGEIATGSGGATNIQASAVATLNGSKVDLGVGSSSAGSPKTATTVKKVTVKPWKKPG